MKRLVALSTALILGSLPAIAAELSEADLAACEADIREHYGEHAELRLVSTRAYMDGTRILVAAHVGPDTKDISRTFLSTCWAPAADTFALGTGDLYQRDSLGAEVAIAE